MDAAETEGKDKLERLQSRHKPAGEGEVQDKEHAKMCYITGDR
jgi:hypothetical protein